MRRILSILAVVMAVMPAVKAQTKSYESQIGYQKTQQTATLIDLPYPEDVVESSIKDFMARKGYKGSGSRGYTVYKNVRLEDGAAELNDLHIKVDRKSRGEKGSSVVTVLTTQPNQDPASRTGRDTVALGRTAAFLEGMAPAIEAGDLEARIKTQGKDTKKAQDRLGDLRSDQVSLEKKIREAQSDLEKNKADQLKETQAMQDNVNSNNADATKKSHKRMDKLLGNQTDLQKKIQKYQASLEQNKKDQDAQQMGAEQQQKALDSLKSQRKG